MNREQQYLLKLICASITEQEIDLPKGEFNWEYMFEFAKGQQLEQFIYPLIKDKEVEGIMPELRHKMQQKHGRAVWRDSKQDMELEEICWLFSEQEIAHIPLKGSVVKHYYPAPEMRRSGDYDILVHNEDRQRAAQILKELGYKQKSKGQTMDDAFEKGTNYLELHVMLDSPHATTYEFLSKVWDYAKVKDGYTYEMQIEFLYAYLLSHLHRHLTSGGGGIKLITDFVMIKRKVKLDMELLEEYLLKAKVKNLSVCVDKLIDKWFYGKGELDQITSMMEQLILTGGAYNNADVAEKMKLSREVKGDKGKFGGLFARVFPKYGHMSIRYPILNRHKWLLPVMWVIRLLDFRCYRPLQVLRALKRVDDDTVSVLNDFESFISK